MKAEEINNNPVPWDEHRIKQLDKLVRLIRDASSIDSSNRIIDRLKRMAELAEELDKTDWVNERDSFLTFLERIARLGCTKTTSVESEARDG